MVYTNTSDCACDQLDRDRSYISGQVQTSCKQDGCIDCPVRCLGRKGKKMINANMGRIKFDGTAIELMADIGCIVRSYRSMLYDDIYTEDFVMDRLRELENMIIDALYMPDDEYDKKVADGLSEKLIKILLKNLGGNIDDDSEQEEV